jgi:hypothetical protein
MQANVTFLSVLNNSVRGTACFYFEIVYFAVIVLINVKDVQILYNHKRFTI